jgi:hypothetical protein
VERQTSEQYHYQQHVPSKVPIAKVDEQTVPVLLCHTCSICNRMRSAGYHRHHPVVPGKPLVLTPCRRCNKKLKSQDHSLNRFMRIRSCTAREPCDWPREPVQIEIDHEEPRGRPRNREKVYIYDDSPTRTHFVRRSSSKTRLGLRALQQDQDMSRTLRQETKVRVSSLDPRRASRSDELWPLPDVVRMRASGPGDMQPRNRANPNMMSRDEIYPPHEVVRTQAYRKATEMPLPQESSRLVELSPSPPPLNTRSTRVVYRSKSAERRPRSVSPVRVRFQEQRPSEEAEARIMSHPRPYRPVLPEHRNFRRMPEETSPSNDYTSPGRPLSPARGILKPTGGERDIPYEQVAMREGQPIDAGEVGGSRVRFRSEEKDNHAAPTNRGQPHDADETRRPDGAFEHYYDYSRRRYIDVSSQLPVEEMRQLRVRQSSPPSLRHYDGEIRNDRTHRISPSSRGRYEEMRVRHVSPLRERELARKPYSPPAPLPLERPAYADYRHVANTQTHSRTRSPTPPPVQGSASEDLTDSDSAHSAEITEVRRWRGIDENGQPATFVEERKTTKMLEQGSERGGQADFRPLGERLITRGWRDV